ncbi:MAG: YjjG family noncanonical pyrimidine nucleotidase [Eubacterium sp.]|nr:YjjG family noncanonical pyrimidine nucleotidase [Eubacterium sp.]
MFKVLLWDLDNTLLNFNETEKRAFKDTFGAFGLGECSDEIAALYSKINLKHWKLLEQGIITKEQVKRGRYEELFSTLNISGVNILEFVKEYERRLGETVIFIENSYDIIKSLKDKYSQYLVTNGTYDVQKNRLKNSGFDKLFNGAFISDEVGYEKPKKEFFDYVLNHIEKCEKDEILIIGDSLTSDMQGGNNIGIKCCLYNPASEPVQTDLKIDYQITKLCDIYSVFKL